MIAVTDLEELRAALFLAGKEIRRLNFGKIDNRVLPILRGVGSAKKVCVEVPPKPIWRTRWKLGWS